MIAYGSARKIYLVIAFLTTAYIIPTNHLQRSALDWYCDRIRWTSHQTVTHPSANLYLCCLTAYSLKHWIGQANLVSATHVDENGKRYLYITLRWLVTCNMVTCSFRVTYSLAVKVISFTKSSSHISNLGWLAEVGRVTWSPRVNYSPKKTYHHSIFSQRLPLHRKHQ